MDGGGKKKKRNEEKKNHVALKGLFLGLEVVDGIHRVKYELVDGCSTLRIPSTTSVSSVSSKFAHI